jgi:hypothetical protein
MAVSIAYSQSGVPLKRNLLEIMTRQVEGGEQRSVWGSADQARDDKVYSLLCPRGPQFYSITAMLSFIFS